MIGCNAFCIGKRKVVSLLILSFLFSGIILSYSSYYQVKKFMPLREVVYFEGGEVSECQEKFDGYGRQYKHGCFINPVSVSQKVLPFADKVLYGGGLKREEETKLKGALDALLENAETRMVEGKEALLLPYNFSWPKYDLKPGWVSGMAQGHAIEVSVAMYRVTGEQKYLRLARKFANAFRIDYEEGGVTVRTQSGVWFEEYAQAGKEPSYALNGHIFAIEGLARLSSHTDSFDRILHRAILATKARVEMYDASWWSRYDLRGTPANQKYHHIHIQQLHWLGTEWGIPELEDMGRKFLWQQVAPFSSFYRVFVYPNRFLVFLFGVNFLFVFFVLYLFILVKNNCGRKV